MSQTRVLMFVAGAALALNGQALAGNNDVIADAAGRTSQLAPAAGYTGGFFEISDGGNNVLRIGGTTQVRYNMSFRDNGTVGDQDDTTIGFNGPTQRLRFHGSIWDKALTYKISGNFSSENPGGGNLSLEEAWGCYNFGNGFDVKWGQQNLGLHRAQLVDREFQQGMDRSIAYAGFSSGYSQGVQMSYTADMFRIIGGFSDGLNTANTDFTSGAEADYALNVRAEVMFMGNDWSRWNDFTSWKSAPDNAFLLGAGVNWQSGGETGGTADVDAFDYTIDAAFEGQGWNVFGAMYGSHIDPAGGNTLDNFGFEISGGFFFTDQLEAFARWDGFFLDDDAFAGDTDINFGSLGMNYYISPESHAVKFTGQVGYAFNDTTNLFGTGGLIDDTRHTFLGDTEDGEIAVSLQMQVMW